MVDKTKYYKAKLKEPDFLRIARFIEKNYGIRLPLTKIIMVQNRLYKRLVATDITSFEEYVKFVFSPAGKLELEAMVDEITTNKTEFFREKAHFEYLDKKFFHSAPRDKVFKIWSAGCSTGEEAYSLAITAEKHRIKYSIVATDLSVKSLEVAKKGLYPQMALTHVPGEIISKFFEKKYIDEKIFYQVKNLLKNHIKFYKLNLKSSSFNVPFDLDIIFLRNVLIYFSMETQSQVLAHVIEHLSPGGLLFIGFSETIYKRDLPLKRLGPSIYKKI